MKDKIKVLLERNYGVPSLKKTIEKLLVFDDDQLRNLLIHGLNISEELKLQYIPGSGFRCWNDNVQIVGVMPVAGLIERKLNNELMKPLHS